MSQPEKAPAFRRGEHVTVSCVAAGGSRALHWLIRHDNRPWGVEGVSRPYDGAVYPQAAGAPVCEGHALAVWDHDGAAGISGGEVGCGHG